MKSPKLKMSFPLKAESKVWPPDDLNDPIHKLPPGFPGDDGSAEALRRNTEMEADPGIGVLFCGFEQLPLRKLDVQRSTQVSFYDRRIDHMTTTLSPKFQIVIPKEVRESLRLKPGTKFEVIAYGSRIELVPVKPMKSMRGAFKGMDTTIERDKDRL